MRIKMAAFTNGEIVTAEIDDNITRISEAAAVTYS
jgi:hypothetical protein